MHWIKIINFNLHNKAQRIIAPSHHKFTIVMQPTIKLPNIIAIIHKNKQFNNHNWFVKSEHEPLPDQNPSFKAEQ